MAKLDDVQVGDILILRYTGGRQVVKVERLTKTQIILNTGARYRRRDGVRVGGTSSIWNRTSVSIPKEGEVEKTEEAQMVSRLVGRVSDATQIHLLRGLTLGQLEKLNAVLIDIHGEG